MLDTYEGDRPMTTEKMELSRAQQTLLLTLYGKALDHRLPLRSRMRFESILRSQVARCRAVRPACR
jgi:hypothetical protein